MSGLLPVELVFHGEPFDTTAVTHVLRHLAMRVGWQFVPRSRYRLVYATTDGGEPIPDGLWGAIVIPSSPAVARHLRAACTPIPVVARSDGVPLPFPQEPAKTHERRPGWLAADVVAGAHASLNLWYEQRQRPAATDGWITYADDWMARAGFTEPQPFADMWLGLIHEAARQLGWPTPDPAGPFTIVVSHDVDYLPRRWDQGLPRLLRALFRQVAMRRRPLDAMRLLRRYLAAVGRGRLPYDNLSRIIAEERRHRARSSFQFVVAPQSRYDPGYRQHAVPWRQLDAEWEVCLHGSYPAARTPGALASERASLERLSGRTIHGYRQHYLNFEPAGLFREVAAAGLRYDMSVGYNDCSGPRAGTYFPFKPYDLEAAQPYPFWEIPFVLMDTTLATTYRFTAADALQHARAVLEPVMAAAGCVAIIWHQEQCGGLLDPGFDRVYFDLLAALAARGGRLTSGAALLPELDAAWAATVEEPQP